MRSIHLLGALVALVSTTSCGSGYGGTGGGATTNVIQFGGSLGSAYSPAALTVKVGDTVTWEGDFGAHPLVSGASCGQPDAKFANSAGATFAYTFNTAGTYPYYCNVHCSSANMKGVITVQ
jgi:plastocyanin